MDVQKRIADLVASHDVVLFMKGTGEAPQCGFSAQVVKVLQRHQQPFTAVNVLDDWDLREGIKVYSNWPTIPQLYVRGKFIGGCDITMDLDRRGELASILKPGATAGTASGSAAPGAHA